MLDFLGIGARRAGEDWLYQQLSRHPEIHFPRHPELRFWSRHYIESLKNPNYTYNIDWYRGIFGMQEAPTKKVGKPFTPPPLYYKRNWFDRAMAALDRFAGEAKEVTAASQSVAVPVREADCRMGDFSPSYNRFDDPRILPAIRDFAPDLRILYIIRNPVHRAWAAAERLRIAAGLSEAETSDQWYIDHFKSAQSIGQGDYAATLSAWQEYFSKEQMLILHYEEALENPRAVLHAAATHIGVKDASYFDRLESAELSLTKETQTPIRKRLQTILEEIYADKRVEAEGNFTLPGCG